MSDPFDEILDDQDLSYLDSFSTNRRDVYGALAGDAIEQSVTGYAFRALKRTFFDDSETVTADYANAAFGIEGHLSFDDSVSTYRARELYEIKQRELVRGSIQSRGNVGMVESFAVSLAASIIDPVGDALALVPYGASVKFGLAGKRAEKATTLGARLRAGAAEGVAAGAITESVIAPLAVFSENRDYGLDDLLLNLSVTGAIGAAARGVTSRSKTTDASEDNPLPPPIPDDTPPASQQAIFQTAVKAVSDGHPADVSGVVQASIKARAQSELGGEVVPIPARSIEQATAYNAEGGELPVTYAVVELDSLIPSHTDNLLKNPRYPGVLQPRDRSENASVLQIQDIASNFVPARLGKNPLASDGAPITSPDGIVESGNGRVLALRKMRNEGMDGAAAYREYLRAEGYPIDGLDFPVLVRVADGARSPEDRVRFSVAANKSSTADMSIRDQGRADASQIPETLLDTEVTGDLGNIANRGFLTSIIKAVANTSELPRLITADGDLSADGLRRVKSAMAAKAYDDDKLLRDMLESTDPDAKAINGALVNIAPRWAHMRALAKSEQIDPVMDITPALVQAVALIRRMRELRAKGERVGLNDLANEAADDMFAAPRANAQRMALHLFYGPGKSGEPLGRAKPGPLVQQTLDRYIDTALSTKGGPSLFGDADAPSQSPDDVIGSIAEVPVERRQSRAKDSEAEPAAQSGNGSGNPTVRPEDSERPAVSRERPGSDSAGEPAEGAATGLDPETTALIDQLQPLVDAGLADASIISDLKTPISGERVADFQTGIRAAARCVIATGVMS